MKTILLMLILMVSAFLFAATAEMPAVPAFAANDIVDSLSKAIVDNYYFIDRIPALVDTYKKHKTAGDYKKITDPNALADRLTADFQANNKDLHFRVMYNPAVSMQTRGNSGCSGITSDVEAERKNNFGFKKVEILPGNVGYLRWDFFSTSYEAYQTAVSALDFVSNTQALIVDMRFNNGGSANMVQFISSYFFNEHYMPLLLNLLDSRGAKIPFQSWTLPYVPGKRMPDIPLYVLTSSLTGSAAEAFSYSLKNVQRATIVGETTIGAAHPVRFVSLGSGFVGIIPIGKISNPLTGTDWEGNGVDPDIAVTSAQAYNTAYKMILDSLAVSTKDETTKFKITWALDGINMKVKPFELKSKDLNEYAGIYGQRTISLKNNQLYYKRTTAEVLMQPMSKDKFALDGMDNFRLRFERDKDGKIINLVGSYEEGREDTSPRSN